MRDAESRFAVSTQSAMTGAPKDGPRASSSDASRVDGSGAPAAGRIAARLGLLTLAIAAFLALAVSPASAQYAHTTVTAEYGKEGPKASGLEGGCNIAYQSANHRLYLATGSKVWGLNISPPGTATPIGSFSPGVGIGCGDPHMAVDNSAGASKNNIYVVPSSNNIYGFSEAGAPLGSPWPVNAGGETCGVAVSNTGEVFGGTYGGSKITRFSPSGSSAGSISPGLGSNCKVAIDQSNNDLYVVKYGGNGVVKLSATGGYSTATNFPATSGNAVIAINGAKKRVYLPIGGQIKAYDTETAALVETISVPGNAESAVAVDETNDTIFVVSGNAIKEIPGANVPKLTTGEPTGNSSVSGTVEPDGGGNVTECFFEFRKASEGSYPPANKQPCEPATLPYTGNQAVTATLPGLVGETEYKYRLIAKNGNYGGVGVGAEKSITPHNVKGLFTEDAAAVTRTSAELKASFEGNGEETKYYFEWCTCGGSSGPYTSQSAGPPGVSAGNPTFPPKTFLTFPLSGLTQNTTYHYRVVAQNGLGISPGADKSFKTLPAVQSLVTEAATSVGPKTATLNASYLGDGTPTSYYFKYGKTTSYGSVTPEVNVPGDPSVTTSLPAEISGLTLETVYHYKVVAKNSLGTTEGADLTLETNPAVAGVITKPASSIDQNDITLNAQFTGNGEHTHYYFEYGQTTKYGSKTAVPPGDDAESPVGVTAISTPITDYEAYSTYHYRVITENNQGITKGKDVTFETLGAPLPAVSGTSASGVSSTGATLEAMVNPERWATVYLFEYGPTTAYGESTEISEPIGSDKTAHPVDEAVTGLDPGTTYHFRALAINFTGTTYGPDQTFKTPGPPRIDLTGSSAVGQTSAHLEASVSPNSDATSVHFEYGPSAAYGTSTAPAPIGSDAAVHVSAADVGGLTPHTTYHFRAVATNPSGTTVGPDQTFTTQAASSPPPPEPVKCKKGFVKRHGKCVRKPKHRKHHRHSTHRHG